MQPSSAFQILQLDEDDGLDEERGPAPYPIGDDAADELYATYSRDLFDERRYSMEPLFITWVQNLLFLAGLQWWRYDGLTAGFRPVTKKSWQEHPVRNILLPYFKFVMAKMTKNRPRTSCVPASTDPDDIHAAQLGDDVLKAKWQELKVTKVVRRALAWLISTGNSYIMPYWNTDSGLMIPLTTLVETGVFDAETDEFVGEDVIECPCDENGDPILDENGMYDVEAEPHYIDMGEVGFKALSPFQVYPDVACENDDEVTTYIISEPLTLREIRRRWPEESGDLVAEDTSEIDRFESLIVGLASGADTHMAGAHYERTDDENTIPKALVLHYYERQSEEYPHGRHWVSVNQKTLEKPGPLPDGIWPPVVHLKEIEVPGQYHGEATMTAAVGLQREYNEVNAQIKEHHNLLLRGKWLVPIGSNIRRGQITAAPGEVIQHTPGLPPQMADLKPLPQKVYEERDQILEDFQLITGVHRVSMGNPPPGVTAGRAFLILEEADDTDLGPMIEMLEESVAELSWLTLQIIQRYYDDERLVRVAGEDRRYRVRSFKGADLTSIVDVEPQWGSAFPWSKTAKQSMMIDLVQTVPDLFVDPETGMFDAERFRRVLPVGGEEAVGQASDIDINEALREEEEFEVWDGEAALPTVGFWQNHQMHWRQHTRKLKSTAFKKWPEENQVMFVQHVLETHQELLAMATAQVEEEEDTDEGGPPQE